MTKAEHDCSRQTAEKELTLKRTLLLPTLLLPAIMAGCAQNAAEPTRAEPQRIGMANPASTYCVNQGGRVEIRNEANGQVGYCHLRDGRVVEEWTLFRAANTPPPR